MKNNGVRTMMRDIVHIFVLGSIAALFIAFAPQSALSVSLPGTLVGGDLTVTGNISKSSSTFGIDHPLDPANKLLFHSLVESPDVKNIYDGIAALDGSGEAIIVLPDYFEALNKDFRYQFFALDVPMPSLYIKKEIQNNRFIIGGGAAGGRVSWQVTGIRQDPYIRANPIIPEVDKGPSALINKGEYLSPELYTE